MQGWAVNGSNVVTSYGLAGASLASNAIGPVEHIVEPIESGEPGMALAVPGSGRLLGAPFKTFGLAPGLSPRWGFVCSARGLQPRAGTAPGGFERHS